MPSRYPTGRHPGRHTRPSEFLSCQETGLLPHACATKVPGSKTASSLDVIRLEAEAWTLRGLDQETGPYGTWPEGQAISDCRSQIALAARNAS